MATRASRGRRPAGSGTREAIEAAARHQFGEHGYQAASLRSIAAEAGVDPRLVLHFFGSKQKLFLSVVELPFDPQLVFPQVIGDGGPGVGRRVAQLFVSMLQTPQARQVLTAVMRAAVSEDEAAKYWRQVVTERLLEPLATQLTSDQPRLRAGLVASQIVGMTMARHVVAVAPLADATSDQLVNALAPVIDYYLTGDLGAPLSRG